MNLDLSKGVSVIYQCKDLKPRIQTYPKVECPVNGCTRLVDRQRSSHLLKEEAFYCPEHRIFISPSTFEYEDVRDNLLWPRDEELSLLNQIQAEKRESRMARERSEDALTWNFFRYLDREAHLDQFAKYITGKPSLINKLIYWSYWPAEKTLWAPLRDARIKFGEDPKRGSEPDLILLTEHTVIFIEVKFTSSNYKPADNIAKLNKYEKNEWYPEVFIQCSHSVAIQHECYELLRFWLLGTWLAAQLNKDFILVNVTPERMDTDVENRFGKFILTEEKRQFKRKSWEELYHWLSNHESIVSNKATVLEYICKKSAGYLNGVLQCGFQLKEDRD